MPAREPVESERNKVNRRDFMLTVAGGAAGLIGGGFSFAAFERPLPYAMMHVLGINPCGGRALLMPKNPHFGAAVMSHQFRHLDGSRVLPGSPIVCDSCGRRFGIARHAIKFVGAG
jgi:hypothetical protein